MRELTDATSIEEFLQQYYKELTPVETAHVLRWIEDQVQREYGLRPHVRDLKPLDGVEYV